MFPDSFFVILIFGSVLDLLTEIENKIDFSYYVIKIVRVYALQISIASLRIFSPIKGFRVLSSTRSIFIERRFDSSFLRSM